MIKTADFGELNTPGVQATGIYIFDGQTDRDLHQIGELLKRSGLLEVIAGSAGFAEPAGIRKIFPSEFHQLPHADAGD